MSDLVLQSLAESKNPILHEIFKEHRVEEQKEGKRKGTESQSLIGNSLSRQFRSQLKDLMSMLASSAPRYVRCIKPNGKMAPGEVDSHDVCRQLRCAGMLDTIRIRKEGYSIRKS